MVGDRRARSGGFAVLRPGQDGARSPRPRAGSERAAWAVILFIVIPAKAVSRATAHRDRLLDTPFCGRADKGFPRDRAQPASLAQLEDRPSADMGSAFRRRSASTAAVRRRRRAERRD